MKVNKFGLAATLLALTTIMAGAVQAQGRGLVPYQEGLHYFEIDNASAVTGDKVEVLELFSYLCSHCSTFEPYINAWAAKTPEHVDFKRVAVVFGRGSWELYARAFATAHIMNLPEEVHMAMMDRLWKEKKVMRSLDEIADFYVQFGADKKKFLSTAQSFAVDGKIRKEQQLVRAYGITGTPSLVVNGKYRISGNAALPSFEAMLDVVDYLVEIERARLKSASVAAE
ncbi:MAG: thiol:disulfide interchange protein DsbA/DsbL [Xanthomonadales bacterium]|nr:thiol:disulfide interchange protein DsbA/DsbL [Gammaproteobacteria bacterium]MBT8050206.1 thiol:disulfide interchange protein DsbA/DsbL [Gammaproteobacteria bacterium]MBT8056239.1 thiol:disulfide interchange protein DsbA/DsbL [Gammaproteobacteria bacterium]NNJ77897.1 thiol:disulfide interchange protein DsbA/DsbL [Xanthomonadales bacterium]NNL04096.1 thiol:disulfide interchange protein DsbA/DsbL [Xanthomonadales bacterium]